MGLNELLKSQNSLYKTVILTSTQVFSSTLHGCSGPLPWAWIQTQLNSWYVDYWLGRRHKKGGGGLWGGVWLLPLFQADPHYLIFDKTRPLPPALPEKKTRAVKPCRCEQQCGLKNWAKEGGTGGCQVSGKSSDIEMLRIWQTEAAKKLYQPLKKGCRSVGLF